LPPGGAPQPIPGGGFVPPGMGFGPGSMVSPMGGPMPGGSFRFSFNIDPNTPLQDLLPAPPKALGQSRLRLIDDPTQAPELAFQEPLANDVKSARHLTAHQIAKINHLNRKK